MNSPNSPLPQPSGATCPNCGAAQSASASYCTNCGAPLNLGSGNSLSPASKIIVSLALGFGALLFGAFGACFALLGSEGDLNWTLALFIALPALAAIACIWGIFKVNN